MRLVGCGGKGSSKPGIVLDATASISRRGERTTCLYSSPPSSEARQLLHDIAPKGYLSREIMELDEPFIEDPGSNLVDVSDVGVDEADGSTVH